MTDNPHPRPELELDFERDLVQDAPDGYDVVDRNGIILYINTNTKTRDGNSFVGTPIYDYFLPEYHELVAAKIAEVFATGQNNQYELATEYWPGKREYYMTNLRPIKRNGEVVAVSLYIRNITDLKTAQHAMVELNTQLEQRVLERTRELQENIANRERQEEILYNIMAAVNEKIELDELLPAMLDMVLSSINCGAGVIHLVDGRQYTRSVFDPDPLPDYYKSALETSRGIALTKGDPFITQKYMFLAGGEGVNSLNAPIRSKGVLLGTISLVGECLREDDAELIRLTTSLADEIGLAVEYARQRTQSGETLILQERQRLARDLHDSVSQSLYGLVLSADISKKLLKIREYDTLEKTLVDIETQAVQSLREMRLMLFELRPISFESEGISGALRLRLNTVEERAGIHTTLEISGEELLSSPLDLEIYRLATEALNNALKHSNAKQVRVRLSVDTKNHFCSLEVCDDGIGFDSEHRTPGGIGLASMQERASRLGGTLKISSGKDAGTTICFTCSLMNKIREISGVA